MMKMYPKYVATANRILTLAASSPGESKTILNKQTCLPNPANQWVGLLSTCKICLSDTARWFRQPCHLTGALRRTAGEQLVNLL